VALTLKNSPKKLTLVSTLRAKQHENAAITLLSIVSIISLFLGGGISWIVSSNIINRLRLATRSLEVISSGDLTHISNVDGRDEIGKLQRTTQVMQEHLLALISQIGKTTCQLSSTSEEVSMVMQQTSENIQLQQAETEQVSKAMNEMSIAVRDVSKSVAGTSIAANEANIGTEKGQQIVQDAVNGIQQLAKQIEDAAHVIAKVEQDSENINTVLDVIKGIAEQTNLLALNAAIEAARAGEQGRGFAVVADEVRTLASRTQNSTAEINTIIEKLQTGARKAAQAMMKNLEHTNLVVDKAKLAGSSLGIIAVSVSQIDDMSSQIASAAEQQNAVAENMNNNIKQINVKAIDNAASVQQVSLAGKELARLAADLQGLVGQFQFDNEITEPSYFHKA